MTDGRASAAYDQERAERAVRELLLALGEDPDREGLKETPARVARAMKENFGGLWQSPEDVLTTTFDIGMLYPIVPQITNGPIRNYDWNPATNLSCDNCANPIAFIKKDVCYSLEAENIYGCKGSDTFCIRVFCENTQAFIPNTFTPD